MIRILGGKVQITVSHNYLKGEFEQLLKTLFWRRLT